MATQGNAAFALRDIDRQVWDEELADFVPPVIYDAHTHLYDARRQAQEPHDAATAPAWLTHWPLASWQALDEVDALLMPGRKVHRICFGNPLLDEALEYGNAFTASQVSVDAESAALMVVRPELSADDMDRHIRRHGFAGAKPYRMHSVTGDVVECRITDYLPEHQIEVLNQHGLMVMLHLAKRRAIGDEQNLDDLQRLSVKYPRVQWVLAHCARSYYDRPLLKAAARLKDIASLWYEISSVCDSDAMDVLLSIAGPQRVMYGSDDLPVGVTRGKYITFGNAWSELNERNHNLSLLHCSGDMTFVRYESLRAFRRACRRRGYRAAEIQDLFCDNARRLIDATRRKTGTRNA